jgi:hypothetical protein
MSGAFIVRPFGERNGIDFDRVERELIAPVLDELAIEGRTTQEIARAGNIRTDMFERLLLADVVIADISVHNANVYYELGIRHALRERITILIRARADDVPFDLRTDRYLEYAPDDPGGSRSKLADAIRQSQRADNRDSPVFLLLPALEPVDPERFRPVPERFTEDVRRAQRGPDLPVLAVLAEEAADFDWGLAGAREVGKAQFELSAWPDARATWEWVRRKRPDDPEANIRLGTVYQRLGDPVMSTAALERVMALGRIPLEEQAEARALMGRNAKDRWIAEWRAAPEEQRAAAALRSPFLESARGEYGNAFLTDQNHWYSGLNALALTAITRELADREPDVWAERFEDEDRAASASVELRREYESLAAAVRRSLEAEAFRRRDGRYDVWADLSRADLRFLTADKPGFVAAAYQQARARMAAEGAGRFPTESAAQQIRIYLELGLFADKARAALEALGAAEQAPAPPPRARVVVFSGHRVDAPDRPQPRFPPDAVPRAAEMIREAVARERELAGSHPIEGIAGGASGGDILFHEICAELGIPTTLLLALPPDEFAAASVADGGPDWMERFRVLCARLDPKVLSTSGELPDWLAVREEYSIWERNNRWTLHTALSRADTDVSLIVLWDGKGGDGPGGTRDMVALAQSRGVRTVRLDASELAASAARE